MVGRAVPRLALSLFAGPLCAQPDGLARDIDRANQLMQAGKYSQAIPIYQRAVKELPGNTGVLLNLALAEHMDGRERQAIPHLEAVLKSQPNHLPALQALAQARLALNEPKLAIPPLEKIAAAEPQNRVVRRTLAAALLDAGRVDEAAARYREFAGADPNDVGAWYGLGTAYQALAAKAFERLQQADPASPYVSALVADTRVKRRQYRSAFFFYQEALKQLPDLHGIHAALADVYRKTGHPDWAAAEDAKESSLPPADCTAHPAECEFLAGRDRELTKLPPRRVPLPETLFWQAKAANELALQAFFRLGQLPPSAEFFQLRAEIARAQGQHFESVKEWRAALAASPGNVRIESELASSLLLASDYAGAFEEAVHVLQRNPTAEMNFVAGDSLLRLEQPARAAPYLESALSQDPGMAAADASLGLALVRLGKHAEAIPHLQRALALDDDGSLHFQLANAYRVNGDADKARATMNQYQEIVKRNDDQKAEVAREAQIGPPR
jgi:tetratricopeptide (TPR) repeat protein